MSYRIIHGSGNWRGRHGRVRRIIINWIGLFCLLSRGRWLSACQGTVAEADYRGGTVHQVNRDAKYR